MQIERVTGHAFGPFAGETLELARGLNVVSGPNESGKSTWHAAIRAGVCGVRRGRGAGTKLEAAFDERHRPWDGDGRWAVEVRLGLDDGRTIDVAQDLAGKVACRATDVVLGRDVSDEIMDGTPDASRWLGLDRDAFAATICVGQSQLASIAGRDTAAALQEHMQRAAATRGTDATAAEARERLEEFRREQIGVDRVNARGPLRSARMRADAARAALDEARAKHDAYLEATARAEAADRVAATLARRTAAVEAALAVQAAAELGRHADRAAELAARHASEPAGPAARDAIADAVAGALDAWRSRPRDEPLVGPTTAALEAELLALPDPPSGDIEVHASVVAARRALDVAGEALELLGPRPAVPVAPSADLDADRLRELARRLRTPEPAPARELEAELGVAKAELERGAHGRLPTVALAGAGLCVLATLMAVAIGQPAVGVVAALLAVVVGAWAWSGGRTRRREARLRLERAHAALAPISAGHAHARMERGMAAEAARAAGLRADADELDRLADECEHAARAGREAAAWDDRRRSLEARRTAALGELANALRARSADVGGDPLAACDAYEAACRARAEAARGAAARPGLERALASRRAAEASAAEAEAAVQRAVDALRAAAEGVGLDGGDPPEALATALGAWQRQRAADVDRADRARGEWQELVTLLDGRPLDRLRDEARAARTRAEHLTARIDRAHVTEAAAHDDLASLLEVEREELDRARADASAQRGALDAIGRDLPDVAEAEEALAEANAELARVTGLAEVVDATLRLLRAAEERVHRDLAPVLAGGISRWLAQVTGGAYLDASVDPADLSVRVKEAATGRWRSALLLSEGTREQIYLLLRAAMAQQLATTGETAPLLLDEPTAQADDVRKAQLLGVLHELSAERQIIVFTHDDDVVDWAERHLDGDRDRLIRLPSLAATPQAAVG